MKFFIIFILLISLHADVKQKMFNLFQNNKFTDACNIGHNYFSKNNKDEEYISLYAFSCLNADYIDRLSVPIAMLKYTKEARANAAYLSTILLQKKLLYHAIVDNYPLNKLTLPSTEHVLSKVFNMYALLGEHEPRAVYFFDDENDSKLSYKLYLEKGNSADKMIIEELYDSVLIKKHAYW